MLLISVGYGGTPRPELHRRAIEAAKAAGVKQIAYTSWVALSKGDTSGLGADHSATEELLKKSGVPYTLLRNSIYQDVLLGGAAKMVADGKATTVPNENKLGYVTRADCAAAAVAVLTTPGHDNKAYDITGPELLGQAEIAAAASAVTGKPIKVVDPEPGAPPARVVRHAGRCRRERRRAETHRSRAHEREGLLRSQQGGPARFQDLIFRSLDLRQCKESAVTSRHRSLISCTVAALAGVPVAVAQAQSQGTSPEAANVQALIKDLGAARIRRGRAQPQGLARAQEDRADRRRSRHAPRRDDFAKIAPGAEVVAVPDVDSAVAAMSPTPTSSWGSRSIRACASTEITQAGKQLRYVMSMSAGVERCASNPDIEEPGRSA